MSVPVALFNAVVVMAFVAQVLNYWLLGRGRINRYLFLFVLSCYMLTETIIALNRPFMWLFVMLNM